MPDLCQRYQYASITGLMFLGGGCRELQAGIQQPNPQVEWGGEGKRLPVDQGLKGKGHIAVGVA